MMWQDIVIAIGAWLLALALIPSILSKDKPSWATSVLCIVVLSVFTATFCTLNLFQSAIAEGFGALLWLVLLIQVLRRK